MTNRRNFIKTTALGAAGFTIGGMGLGPRSYASVIGANDRINMAVVGVRSRGRDHINNWSLLKHNRNVRIKTICDVDEQFFAPAIKLVQEKSGDTPLTVWDMRKVFEDKDIDAVSFAVPNHWHALSAIWACQAGKHVYAEKPTSHNLWEGRKMVEAAAKYNVRVQTGCQNRSIANVIAAINFLHNGGIGEVFMAKGLCYKPRDSFGIAPDGNPPESLHYDMWLGPAPYRQYNEKRVHYNWHWFWATGNGDTGNQGPHQFDIARWGLNKNEHPVTIYSMGGLYGIDPAECAQETPNTQTSMFKYKDGKILEFETRGRYTNDESSLGIRIGNIFYGTEGYLELDGDTWKAFRKREKEPFAGSQTSEGRPADPTFLAAPGGSDHFANFLDAIRSGKDETLHCHVSEGHLSSSLPLLANISYLLGRQLTFDGAREKFVNDREADALLTREYRKPYIVPEKV
ncbi:MAG TPA: Gfo/Idh/MocA family oxidoreductase [Bacteroidales bacterium]|jgi:predicted dehydrogenase|nr:Gfo/Idh/MocA family oxidoreductase [Bacteroidales bacterium]